jgi:hypothetical protein
MRDASINRNCDAQPLEMAPGEIVLIDTVKHSKRFRFTQNETTLPASRSHFRNTRNNTPQFPR